MAFVRVRVRTSEGLFPFSRRRVAFSHSLGGHCTEWWPGGGESHSQLCLGARRAAEVAPAVAGGRGPQSALCCQRHLWDLQLTMSVRMWREASASAVTHGACACKQQCHHLQPAPLPEQENGVKPPKGKSVLLRIGVTEEKPEQDLFLSCPCIKN